MIAEFDDIRPYREDEIPAAMHRIADTPLFGALAAYVYPDWEVERVRALIKNIRTVSEFQLEVMRRVNEQVIARSITELSCDGIDGLDPRRPYLFISNHRDIVLDSCLLQYILHQHGHATTQITFGANLMESQLVIDIGKSNKMFRVERGGNTMRDFYKSSTRLSDYIRHVLTEERESVWIAQRNGRTKDGRDATDQGIVKMFCMSWPEDRVKALVDLNIVPVAVSYEWEPCDILKTIELYASRHARYIKKPGEDLNSILTGIMQPKGRVHFSVCAPLTEAEISACEPSNDSRYHRAVAALIDRRIRSHYRLFPNNYIARDLFDARTGGKPVFSGLYTEEEKRRFVDSMTRLDKYIPDDRHPVPEREIYAALKEIFLGIYANPVQ